MAITKLVRIKLAALTRVEYTEVVEVPADMTDEELEALVDDRYKSVDGGEYVDDAEYWERSGSCGFEEDCDGEEPTKRVRRTNGELVVTDI